MDEQPIGFTIRRLRGEKGMTLLTLAQRSGLTKGYLSKVEHGQKTPPVSTLSRIAQALGVQMADFFEIQAPNRRIVLIRPGDRQPVSRDGSAYGYRYETLAHTYGRKVMEPFILTFIPHARDKHTFTHDGEEMIYVLEGRMRFVHGDEAFVCEEGDCVYFDASIPHRGESIGDRETKVLIVIAARTAGP